MQSIWKFVISTLLLFFGLIMLALYGISMWAYHGSSRPSPFTFEMYAITPTWVWVLGIAGGICSIVGYCMIDGVFACSESKRRKRYKVRDKAVQSDSRRQYTVIDGPTRVLQEYTSKIQQLEDELHDLKVPMQQKR